MALAKQKYERQKRLWDKEIGSEMQYLEAKSHKESLERRYETLAEELSLFEVRAPFAGRIDELWAQLGQSTNKGTSLLRLLSTSDIYLTGEVSDAYIHALHPNDTVRIRVLSSGATYYSQLQHISKVVNTESRTFSIRVQAPRSTYSYQPNQTAILYLRDTYKAKTLTIPSKVIQTGAQGTFVYTLDTINMQARKVSVKTGITHQGKTEIIQGLNARDVIIAEGYADVVDGISVRVVLPSISP